MNRKLGAWDTAYEYFYQTSPVSFSLSQNLMTSQYISLLGKIIVEEDRQDQVREKQDSINPTGQRTLSR